MATTAMKNDNDNELPRVDQLWKQLRAFTPPDCPICLQPASLDKQGFYCLSCDTPCSIDPSVSNIPHTPEFAKLFDEWRKLQSAAIDYKQ